MRAREIAILLLAACAAAADDAQLTTTEVDGLVTRAALAVDSPTLVIAVTDRAGASPSARSVARSTTKRT